MLILDTLPPSQRGIEGNHSKSVWGGIQCINVKLNQLFIRMQKRDFIVEEWNKSYF